MKYIQLLAFAVAALFAGQLAYPYAIMNDKYSVSDATIYVFQDKDKYLKLLGARGVPDQVLGYAEKISAAAPAIGAALAVPTEGASLIVGAAIPISVQVAKQIVKALQATGTMDAGMRKLAGVVAVHRDVKPGNKGRGAEWNWKDIEKEYGVPEGGLLYVVVTDKEHGIPLLQTTMTSNGMLGFIIKKDAKGQLYAELSPVAIGEYEPSTSVEEKSLYEQIKSKFEDLVK